MSQSQSQSRASAPSPLRRRRSALVASALSVLAGFVVTGAPSASADQGPAKSGPVVRKALAGLVSAA